MTWLLRRIAIMLLPVAFALLRRQWEKRRRSRRPS